MFSLPAGYERKEMKITIKIEDAGNVEQYLSILTDEYADDLDPEWCYIKLGDYQYSVRKSNLINLLRILEI